MWADVGLMGIVAFVFFCVVFLVPDGNVLTENGAGDLLGRISYSLYLLHLPVLMLLLPLVQEEPLAGLPLFLTCALVVSWISYAVLERPSRARVRKSLGQRSKAVAVEK